MTILVFYFSQLSILLDLFELPISTCLCATHFSTLLFLLLKIKQKFLTLVSTTLPFDLFW